MKWAWAALPILAATGGVACGPSKPAEQKPAAASPVPPAPSAPPSTTATALSSAQPAPPKRVPLRESTPGKIQCETVDCDLATEVCCVTPGAEGGSEGRCAPKSAGREGVSPCCPNGNAAYCNNDSLTIERRCDEALDCAAGQACCALGAAEGDLATESCDTRCFAERCLAGSTCSNGNSCATEEGAPGGECPRQIKPPKCGAATCKKGELCCWDRDGSSARCAASCDEETDAAFACTAPDQCAPHECHAHAGGRPETYVCGGEGFFSSVLCQTLKDCPPQLNSLGTGPDAPKVKRCAHTPDLPAGVKACDYQ